MLLTITTTHQPATDLGYLLHKNPVRPQSFPLSYGQAHVFYPEASAERCTAALLLEIDPVALVRGRGGSSDFTLDQYVNDRPYVASSFLSVAINQVFGSALAGRSKDRPALVDQALPLSATVAVVPARGGEQLLHELWEPLGYSVTATNHPLSNHTQDWGSSPYFTLELRAMITLRELLSHLYVLMPVLDDDKHYYVGNDEVEKLLRFGGSWLAAHPARELITQRYLRHYRQLTSAAFARLSEPDQPDPDALAEQHALEEARIEETVSLQRQRMGSVLAALKASGAQRVLDLGCGEGQLLQLLLHEPNIHTILGVDVAHRALARAHQRLQLDRLPSMQRERINLIQSALNYRDQRLAGYDAAAIVEVIEHLDMPRLAAFERVVFEFAQPRTVIMTTPNAEYNVRWASLPAGRFRHRDHRFEWTRAEFQGWAQRVAQRFAYTVRFVPIGPEDAALGSPTQMAIFTLGAQHAN